MPAGAQVFINEGQAGRTVPLWFNFDGLEVPTVAATIETATDLANGVTSGDTGLRAVQGRLAAGLRTQVDERSTGRTNWHTTADAHRSTEAPG